MTRNENTADNVTFDAPETFEGVTEWYVYSNGECIGEMQRERPTRWHGNGVSGLVRDNEKAWIWTATVRGDSVSIPDGSTLRAAKRIVRAAVAA